MPTLFTVGHGTRQLAELVEVLKENGAKILVDVRTVPKSRTNPQFNKEALTKDLDSQHGIQYLWLGKELGGLRSRDKSSDLNAGWDNDSFRGYADYMQTQEFRAGLQQLMEIAEQRGPAAIMCAETVYFCCHRSLISDALAVRGWEVLHIINKGKAPSPHKITKFAAVQGECITYPSYPHTPKSGGSKKRKEEGGTKQAPGASRKRAKRAAED